MRPGGFLLHALGPRRTMIMCGDEMIGYEAKQAVAVLPDLVCDGNGKSAMRYIVPPICKKQ